MKVSTAAQAELEERRAALIRLRRTRTPYDDPRILNLGYQSAAAARKDFYRAVTARREATAAEVADYREEQNEIINSLLDTYLPLALGTSSEDGETTEPDVKAAEMSLKLLERQAKLNGWEAALKAELSGPGGGAVPISAASINELRSLINTAGDPDPNGEDSPYDGDDSDTDDDGDDET
jgi:hypothetical protein